LNSLAVNLFIKPARFVGWIPRLDHGVLPTLSFSATRLCLRIVSIETGNPEVIGSSVGLVSINAHLFSA
jgi:hypothetical protein